MSLELEDNLMPNETHNDMKKRTSLPAKIFSIENLLNNGSNSQKSEIEKEMSTRGSSDGEEEEADDLSEQEDLEICNSNGEQIYYNKKFMYKLYIIDDKICKSSLLTFHFQ